MISKFSSIGFLVAFLASTAIGQPLIGFSGGEIDRLDITPYADGSYDVDIKMISYGNALLRIRPNIGTNLRLRNVNVEAVNPVNIEIFGYSGGPKVTELQSLHMDGNAGELRIENIEIEKDAFGQGGNIGIAPGGGGITATRVGRIYAENDFYGGVTILPIQGNVVQNIDTIEVGGNLQGRIETQYGGIVGVMGVTVAGSIGASVSSANAISVSRGITNVSVGGELRRSIEWGDDFGLNTITVSGHSFGNLKGGFLGPDQPGLPGSPMLVGGNFAGEIALAETGSGGAVRGLLTIGGNFDPSYSISIAGSVTEHGGIVIEGQSDSPITISGDLNGIIDIALFNPGCTLTVDGDLSGDILIRSNARGLLDFGAVASDATIEIQGFLGRRLTVHENMLGVLNVHNNMQNNGNPSLPYPTGELDFRGDFGGVVLIGGYADGEIGVEGDLSGALYIGEDLLQPLTVGGELSGLLLIGRDLDAAGSITMDGPLSGQIIINEQNHTPPGIWGGPVTLPTTMPNAPNPITIGPGSLWHYESPHYIIASEFVGGGAIGLAPFSFHPTDTEGGNSCENLRSITLRHYGPVYADGSDPPIKVFALDGAVEVEVTTDFTISVDDDPFTLDRKVTITLPSDPNISFANNYPGLRIEPVRAPETGYSVLRCAWVEGNPPVYDWSFSQVHDCDCQADLNGDGVVDADDFFLFLQLFADGDPRADINNDGVIDADDFFAYLTFFAAGC